ncbi:SpoIIIAH-like family protein [Shouchella shacheensis]|uniref:SpoIIIAH-like family protein n=1 Tax=Shouchella shacheensis TaxID=1649580 RepID=UPI00074002F1|nr:SpoIIIAH-like family protein [Shouchella shacheensis]
MVLKKQTVWLLTMLSLMIVLSVYYFTPDTNPGDSVAFDESEEANEESAVGEDELETSLEVNEEGEVEGDEEGALSEISGSVSFTEARMQLEETRSKRAEEFTRAAASEDATAEEQVEAHDKSMEILAVSHDEEVLESLIKAEGYQDALVMTHEDQVQILVQADELTKSQAAQIMAMAEDRLGSQSDVSVQIESTVK